MGSGGKRGDNHGNSPLFCGTGIRILEGKFIGWAKKINFVKRRRELNSEKR